MIKLLDLLNEAIEEKKADRCLRIARRKYDKPGAYRSGAIVRCRKGDIWKDIKEEKENIHKWFSRQGAPGSSSGWVDCNTCRKVDGKSKCKACGRAKGEQRSKKPKCRPTPSACTRKK